MNRHASFAAACTAALVVTALASGPAVAAGTYKQWNGSSIIEPFGCPNTTTYGQVITIPANKHFLNNFVFSWINLDSGSFVARGEVYAWDGTKATGSALWEGTPRTFSFNDGVFHKVHFNTGVLAVTPGQKYVVFASIDKDYEKCQNSYEVGWGFVGSDVYHGGNFVYQNNGGDENQWTTSAWNDVGADAAFAASLTP